MKQGPQPNWNELLNTLIHKALVAEKSCSNREQGSHAALCAYGEFQQKLIAIIESS